MSQPTRHRIEWSAAGLRRAAAQAGVALPVAYARALAADGLDREPVLAVSRLGDGVVIHTKPDTNRRLPILLGYADGRGQWYRDGRRHQESAEPAAPAPDAAGVEL
jgi:hypothetical protein